MLLDAGYPMQTVMRLIQQPLQEDDVEATPSTAQEQPQQPVVAFNLSEACERLRQNRTQATDALTN